MYTVGRRISWRLPYIVARLAGRESDFWGLSKTSPATIFGKCHDIRRLTVCVCVYIYIYDI